MATIVTRSGKGSPLTNTEVDANFTNLNTDKVEPSTITTFGASLVDDADAAAARTTLGLGAAATLATGISNTNVVKIDSSSVADDEYARFTANGLESRSASEVADDIGSATKGFATAMAIAL